MSLVLQTFCYFIVQITLLLSVLFLLMGHNYPGGGFIGALIACTGIGFHVVSYRKPPAFIAHRSVWLVNIGLFLLALSAVIALFFQHSLLTGIWCTFTVLGHSVKLGTPLLFDVGIYLAVLGGLLWVITCLERDAYD